MSLDLCLEPSVNFEKKHTVSETDLTYHSDNMPEVGKFYAGKTIFITGVTGFLGQVLLSKLLCSCQELRRIYILIREKKGKSVNERLEELFNSSIFQQAKEMNPDYKTKVKSIKGDCSLYNLGISDSDRAIIETESEIIFHLAATVRFDGHLREAVNVNIRSTDTLLDWTKNMENLKAFMYVSTAFSACAERELIEEKFYDPPIKADNLLTLVEQLDDRTLDSITPRLIKPHPNTYIYTKLIAENLCLEKSSKIPICVFRPAIVSPCYKEPLPGWICNTYGPTKPTAAYGLGMLRVVPVDRYCKADSVPGDYAVNALIVSAVLLNEFKEKNKEDGESKKPIICNYSATTTTFIVTWQDFIRLCDKALEKYPFYSGTGVNFPAIKCCSNPIVYKFWVFLLHFFPAFVIDQTLAIMGKQPRYVKLYKKIHQLFALLTPFTGKHWITPNSNLDELWRKLSFKEREIFYYNLNEINVEEYFETYIRGIRLYIAKEEEDTIDRAIEKRKFFFFLQYVVIGVVIMMFLNVFMCFCSSK